MQAILMGVIALLVGVGIAYLSWGSRAGRAATDLTAVRARLEETRAAAVREGGLATKIQEAEARIKEARADLEAETDLRQKLEQAAATQKKP